MSLLAKSRLFNRVLKPGFILMIPVFLSCETSDDLGVQYRLDSDSNVTYVEFTLPATNIYLDSLRTDGEGVVLAGTYNDNFGGTLSAEGYFDFTFNRGPLPRAPQTKDTNPEDTLKFDSIAIVLEIAASLPDVGDAYRGFEFFELRNSLISSAVYLSSLTQEKGDRIGVFEQNASMVLDTIIRVKLADSYGQKLFNQLSETAFDTTRFIISEEFSPLGIVSNGSSSLSAFDLISDTSRLIIYSSPIENPDTVYQTSFRFSNPLTGGSTKNYSMLDRSDVTIETIDNNDLGLLNDRLIIDPVYGVTTSISLDPLQDFFEENENIIINNAALSLEFENENFRDTLENFFGFYRRENGIFGPGVLRNSFAHVLISDNGYLRGAASPVVSTLTNDKKSLSIGTTLFLQTLYRNFQDNGGLSVENPLNGEFLDASEIAFVSQNDLTLQRIIFRPDGIKLRIYYTEVN